MSTGWAIFAFILTLGFLIFIHELGHLIAAKALGVKVLEFGIGFPPRLFTFKRGETKYSLNLIPLGGYNKMLGEVDPSEPGSLASKSIGARIVILSAGSIMMFLFPLVLFSIVNMVPHNTIVGGEGIQIVQVAPNSPAEAAGLRPGDEIISIEGKPVKDFEALRQVIYSNLGSEISLTLLRKGREIKVRVIPRKNPPKGEGPLGIAMGWARLITERRAYPPWKAIPLGAKQSWRMVMLLKYGIEAAIAGEVPFTVTGIIGIGQATSEVAKGGILQLLIWAAFLSINLGIINLFPFPSLDGGRIAFVLLEWVRRGKRISPKVEGIIHFIGFVILIGLVFVISYYDILRLIRGESLFK